MSITVKNNFLTRLFVKGAVSSLKTGFVGHWNQYPIVNFEKLTQAITNGYCNNDAVYSIVSKKAQVGSRAPFGVYKIKSTKAHKVYKSYLKQNDLNLDKILELKESAIEPISHPLNDLWNSPNEEMSGSEYTEALLIYLNLTGNAFEYAQRDDSKILQLHALPADVVQIISDGKFPIGVGEYQLWVNEMKRFAKEDVIHTKYFNPKWTNTGSHLYGLSPIQTAWGLINADTEGFDAMAEQRKNRGPRKLVGVQNEVIRNYADGSEMMDALAEVFNNKAHAEYKGKLMPIFGKIDVQDVGVSAKDMEVLESGQVTFDRLCNIFKLPVEWFNSTKQSKYNNLENFNKQAILNGVFPDLNRLRDSRQNWAIRNKKIKESEDIDYDYSVYTELQTDKAEQWKWLENAPFTENEKRVFMEEATLSIPEMDKVYINRNKVPIEMAGLVPEINANQNGQ